MKTRLTNWVAVTTVVLGLGASVGYHAFADQNDGDDNPYIELYRLRVTQAEANSRRKSALAQLAASKLERGRRLIASRAMSQEEYETLVSDDAVAKADIDLASQKVEESKAYLKIITGLVNRGVSIPLCTYEME